MKTLPNHYITTDAPTWKDMVFPIMVLLVLLLCHALVAAYDERVELKWTVGKHENKIEQLERDAGKPGIFLESAPDKYRCSSPAGIRDEWSAVVAQKCDELAKAMWAGRRQ